MFNGKQILGILIVGTRIFTGIAGTGVQKVQALIFSWKKVFKKSLNILKYSLGIIFYAPIGFTAICLAIVYL